MVDSVRLNKISSVSKSRPVVGKEESEQKPKDDQVFSEKQAVKKKRQSRLGGNVDERC